MNSLARNMRRILYALDKVYGATIQIKKTLDKTYNLETGAKTADYLTIIIKRAIVLPQKYIQDFVYDLSFIAANKNFTYGGLFDKNTRYVIISLRALGDIAIDKECHCMIEGLKYAIAEMVKLEDGKSLLMRCVNVGNTEE